MCSPFLTLGGMEHHIHIHRNISINHASCARLNGRTAPDYGELSYYGTNYALWLHDRSRFMTHDIMIYNDTIMIKHSYSNMFACRLSTLLTSNMWYVAWRAYTYTYTQCQCLGLGSSTLRLAQSVVKH